MTFFSISSDPQRTVLIQILFSKLCSVTLITSLDVIVLNNNRTIIQLFFPNIKPLFSYIYKKEFNMIVVLILLNQCLLGTAVSQYGL